MEVIDLHITTFRQRNYPSICSKTNRIVSVEEGWPFSGIGSEICTLVCNKLFYLDAQPLRVTAEDVPLPYAANLEKTSLYQVLKKIVRSIKTICYRS